MTGSPAVSGDAAQSAAANASALLLHTGPIGVVVALPAEARCLARNRLPSGRAFAVGTDMLLCINGIGEFAADAASRMLVGAGAGALVSWGVAAGLDPSVASGTLILADRVAVAGLDAPSTPAQRESGTWLDRLEAQLSPHMTIVRGPIAVAHRVLRTASDKRALADAGVAAADMETGAVAAVARAAGLPWIAIRAVADAADDTVPRAVLLAVDRLGKFRRRQFAGALMRHPADLFRLPRLARGFGAAQRTLRAVARHAGPGLLAPGAAPERGDGGSVGEARP